MARSTQQNACSPANGQNLGSFADLNGDGKPDILSSPRKETILWASSLGKGNGKFAPPKICQPVRALSAVVAADLNDDGIIDLAAVNHDDATLSIFLGKGNDVFEPARHFPTGKGPHRLAVADLDRDGLKDIVVGCKEGKAAWRSTSGAEPVTPRRSQRGRGPFLQEDGRKGPRPLATVASSCFDP